MSVDVFCCKRCKFMFTLIISYLSLLQFDFSTTNLDSVSLVFKWVRLCFLVSFEYRSYLTFGSFAFHLHFH